jgi:hypothetical protein
MFCTTSAGLSYEACCVAIIHHHQGIVSIGEITDPFQVCDDAIHGEDPIGNDDLEARAFGIGFLELLFQIGHVVVGVAVAGGLAQAYTIDDARVVQRIADNGILLIEQGFKNAAIGIEACCIEYGILCRMEFGDLLFQFFVYVLGAADEPYRGHAITMGVKGLMSGLDHLGM